MAKGTEADIYLLQETHCENNVDIENWSKEWEGETFWSTHTNMSCGVAVFIRPRLKLNINNVEKDNAGRYISIEVEFDDKVYKVINIYAPNNGQERATFITKQKRKISQYKIGHVASNIIVGGDFNCTSDVTLDRRKNTCSNNVGKDKGSKELKDLMVECNLEDVWRRRCPHKRRYTYFKTNSHSASRIDLWLIEKGIDSSVLDVKIGQAFKTDHAAIMLTIQTADIERGPGYWKMNNKAIESELFVNTFTSFWKYWKEEIHNYENKRLWWDITKCKIKQICVQISKELKGKQNKEIKHLELLLENEKHKDNPNTNDI